jgi:MoaA/NifB/PqqE/SkfB family radical SAM enzyme
MSTDPTRASPTSIRIEASSSCQLRCPECPTTQGLVHRGAVGRGTLRAANFRALLDLNPSLESVELSNWGEAFLNPELALILELAHEHGVAVTLGNGVNLNNASEQALEAVVKYGVRDMTVSLDGASQRSYETYRVRGDLERVLTHVRTINQLKARYRTDLPRLAWQFVVFGHNEHEIAHARRLAEAHGMAFAPKLNWSADYSPPKDREGIKRSTALEAASVEQYREERGAEYLSACLQLWDEPQVNWDGKILGCCVNYWGELGGNAFDQPVAQWANSEGIRHARAMLTGRAQPKPAVPCTTCDVFARMAQHGSWLDPSDLDVRKAARTGDHAALTRALRERLRARRSKPAGPQPD